MDNLDYHIESFSISLDTNIIHKCDIQLQVHSLPVNGNSSPPRLTATLTDGVHFIPAAFETSINKDQLLQKRNTIRLTKFRFTKKAFLIVLEVRLEAPASPPPPQQQQQSITIHPIVKLISTNEWSNDDNRPSTTLVSKHCNCAEIGPPLHNIVSHLRVHLAHKQVNPQLFKTLVDLALNSPFPNELWTYFKDQLLPLVTRLLANPSREYSPDVYEHIGRLLYARVPFAYALAFLDTAIHTRHWSLFVLINPEFLNTLLTPLRANQQHEQVELMFELYFQLMMNYKEILSCQDNITAAFGEERFNQEMNRWLFDDPSSSTANRMEYFSSVVNRGSLPPHLVSKSNRQAVFESLVTFKLSTNEYSRYSNVISKVLSLLGDDIINNGDNQDMMISQFTGRKDMDDVYTTLFPYVRSFDSCLKSCLDHLDSFVLRNTLIKLEFLYRI
ncbi:hypothetical protein SAMD00019534_098930 [Acytostelium subglobosum LB1]|uniref:hypothetical protein n=1 Tax=Acytostelium subglobosum LB1 TaxID=1410327 RepID=UPI000644BA98|nr:hypothetical protein SAMD00019534_098930 [Acytostelium subglobosum LB1]GAM26718.1 hypothetical protein SAMD00019534_098930 [Acytostelium subglobosum LB1]|eukprot:XP_012750379.1 hypothetical protein SAMD00019534_098930 [Acytostelium subglobosum LB1]